MDEDCLTTEQPEPSAQDVLGALDALLASETLRLSERNRRFLSFVVTQTVAGRADRIKAYAIGVDVFGRDETFDPTLDPIVRIEATRLRTALTGYYENGGEADRVRIAIPPGSYVPTFSWAPAADDGGRKGGAIAPLSATKALSPTIVIHDHSGLADPEVALRGELFADALVTLLRKAGFRILVVPPAERSAAAEAIHAVFAHPGNACSLDIAVRPLMERRRYSWRFTDLRNSEVLASDFCDCPVAKTPCFDLIDGIAEAAVDAIAAELAIRRPFPLSLAERAK